MGFDRYVPLDVTTDLPLQGDLHRWLANFDKDFYRTHKHSNGVADLSELSDPDLYQHFLRSGIHEGRAYNRYFYSFLEPDFYVKRYPELRLANNWQAIRHWMYVGVYERRTPNRMTQQLLEADIHMFQMGKVGSKAIAEALFKAGHEKIVPHLHWANEIVKSYPQSFFRYEEIVNRDPYKKLIFISGVRDPVERVVSGLFQSASEAKSSLGIAELVERFKGPAEDLERYLAPHLQPVLDWFSHGYFRGIDVYRHPFDTDLGYHVIRRGPVCIFLYRLDALDRCWAPLSELLGRKIVPAATNESRLKPYAPYFEDAMQAVRGTTGRFMRKKVVESPYWRHFFEGGSVRATVGTAQMASPTTRLTDVPSRQSLPNSGPASVASSRLIGADRLAGRWVRLDFALRTSLNAPPLSSLVLSPPRHDVDDTRWRLPLLLDSRGRVRFYFRVPDRCGEILLEPSNADGDFAIERLSLRERSAGRLIVEVFLIEIRADPKNFARKLWRALFHARHYGWLTFHHYLLVHFDCNVAGYGFASAPDIRDQWSPYLAASEFHSAPPTC